MGDISDYYINQTMREEPFFPDHYIWTMANGQEIIISKMTTAHIKNCLNLLRKGGIYSDDKDTRERWIRIFTDELKTNGRD